MSPAQKLSKEKAKRPPKPGRYANPAWNCRLLEMRTRLNLTLRDIADKTGISNPNIWAIEHGSDPQLTTARKLCEFLQCTTEEMWPSRYGSEFRKGAKS